MLVEKGKIIMNEEEIIELINKLKYEGLITAKDAPHYLNSRSARKNLYNRILPYFCKEEEEYKLLQIGNYFGGYVVDSYAIFYEENESHLTYEEALKIFENENKEINKNDPI